jgi:NAD(P)-dependent dehydrogenase (short-subunit alcohol dehydrogenase family)
MPCRVLITGANRGIGLELARQLAARGDDVVATCRDPESATELRALDVTVARLDVTSAEDVARLIESTQGPLDVLINNAGVGVRGQPLGSLDYDRFARFFDTNAMGPVRVAEAFLPRLRSGERRVIASITSRMGSIADNTSGGSYEYRASKAALNMANRSMAVDLGPEGFVCMVLHPGWVQTEMGGSAAPTTTDESATGLIKLIDAADSEYNGGFYDYTGQLLPW